MDDVIEKVGGSTVHHGPLNARAYLMKLHEGDLPDIIGTLDQLARRKGYTKVSVKVPAGAVPWFEKEGYQREAHVPRFFKGVDEVFFLAKFFSQERQEENNPRETRETLARSCGNFAPDARPPRNPLHRVEPCETTDAEALSRLYRAVFPTYPFPVHDPEYLIETMKSHVRCFCVRDQGVLVAAASSEMDVDNMNVEMTDFATLPGWRNLGLAACLLERMEKETAQQGLCTAYTIARALSLGMNRTFHKAGYAYGGTLINNTHISGHIESMNVWYKDLRR